MSEKRKLRRQSRELAIKAFFYYLESERDPAECFQYVLYEVDERGSDDFAYEIFMKGVDNFKKLKVLIRAFAPEFPFEKIAPINRVLLCLGMTEMKFVDTPPVVVINEYIELSKLYGESKSAALLNGVLDEYRKNLGLNREKEA